MDLVDVKHQSLVNPSCSIQWHFCGGLILIHKYDYWAKKHSSLPGRSLDTVMCKEQGKGKITWAENY